MAKKTWHARSLFFFFSKYWIRKWVSWETLWGQFNKLEYETYIRKSDKISYIWKLDYGSIKECPCPQEIYAEVFRAEGHDVCNLLSIGSAIMIIIISGPVYGGSRQEHAKVNNCESKCNWHGSHHTVLATFLEVKSFSKLKKKKGGVIVLKKTWTGKRRMNCFKIFKIVRKTEVWTIWKYWGKLAILQMMSRGYWQRDRQTGECMYTCVCVCWKFFVNLRRPSVSLLATGVMPYFAK